MLKMSCSLFRYFFDFYPSFTPAMSSSISGCVYDESVLSTKVKHFVELSHRRRSSGAKALQSLILKAHLVTHRLYVNVPMVMAMTKRVQDKTFIFGIMLLYVGYLCVQEKRIWFLGRHNVPIFTAMSLIILHTGRFNSNKVNLNISILN